MLPKNTQASLENSGDKSGSEDQMKVQSWVRFWACDG